MHRLQAICLAALGALGLLTLASCGGDGSTPPSGQGTGAGGDPAAGGYSIVTTCGMVTDLVTRVAGDRATVRGMMRNDVDPHTYNPTRNDIATLEAADVIFYSGLNLEARLSDALVRMAGSGKRVAALTSGIDPKDLLEPEEFEGHFDPHVWNDASLWAASVSVIRDTLSAQDPAGRSGYEERATALEREILAVHDYAKQCLATIPEASRVLVTAHDAFNYFGRAYGIEVHGVQGVTTEHEAGLAEITRLVTMLTERKVNAIFVEQAFEEDHVQAVVEGAQARGHDVRIGGKLYSDAMGEPGSYRGTFVGMVDHNVTLITRALGGKAPEQGLYGKLTW
ncbi:MAG: zinc ABC transporter substrate-binding protein [bacterium]|nr:zinc ABC transporter substrate-binding protein [bacterium]